MKTPLPADDLRLGMYITPIYRFESGGGITMFGTSKEEEPKWEIVSSGRPYRVVAIDLPFVMTVGEDSDKVVFDVRVVQFKVLNNKYVECIKVKSKPESKHELTTGDMLNALGIGKD